MRTLICLLLATAIIHAADKVDAKAALDGREFSVQMTDNGAALDRDRIVFAAGKAEEPEVRQRYGFEKAAYTAAPADKKGGISFTVTMTSGEHGQIVLAGKITGHEITGTRTWTKAGKPAIVHQFTGKEQESAPPPSDRSKKKPAR
jgi:hypothetical protein